MSYWKKVMELLKTMDLDSDGFITPEELHAKIKLEGASTEDWFMDTLLTYGRFAADDGKVKIKKVGDFVKILEEFDEIENDDQENQALRKLFNFFDENGDGKLSKTEAKIGIRRRDGRAWDSDDDEMFDKLKDEQGKVSIEGEQ